MAIYRRFLLPTILLTSVLISGCQLIPSSTPPATQIKPDGAWHKQDDLYSITVNYSSPGGQETNNFNFTLDNGTITAVTIDVLTDIDASRVYQKQFALEVPKLLVGKKLSQIKALDVISGASLTTTAFNDALNKLKQQL